VAADGEALQALVQRVLPPDVAPLTHEAAADPDACRATWYALLAAARAAEGDGGTRALAFASGLPAAEQLATVVMLRLLAWTQGAVERGAALDAATQWWEALGEERGDDAAGPLQWARAGAAWLAAALAAHASTAVVETPSQRAEDAQEQVLDDADVSLLLHAAPPVGCAGTARDAADEPAAATQPSSPRLGCATPPSSPPRDTYHTPDRHSHHLPATPAGAGSASSWATVGGGDDGGGGDTSVRLPPPPPSLLLDTPTPTPRGQPLLVGDALLQDGDAMAALAEAGAGQRWQVVERTLPPPLDAMLAPGVGVCIICTGHSGTGAGGYTALTAPAEVRQWARALAVAAVTLTAVHVLCLLPPPRARGDDDAVLRWPPDAMRTLLPALNATNNLRARTFHYTVRNGGDVAALLDALAPPPPPLGDATAAPPSRLPLRAEPTALEAALVDAGLVDAYTAAALGAAFDGRWRRMAAAPRSALAAVAGAYGSDCGGGGGGGGGRCGSSDDDDGAACGGLDGLISLLDGRLHNALQDGGV